MIISVTHNFIFQKVAKTASCSMELALRPYLDAATDTATEIDDRGGPNIDRFGPHGIRTHEPASKTRKVVGPEFWNAAFKFAFVRDPWDKTVSFAAQFLRPDFEELDKKNAPVEKYQAVLAAWLSHRRSWFKKPIGPGQGTTGCWNQVTLGGKLAMDFIGRYENMEEDWQKVCDHLGINAPLPNEGHGTKTSNRLGKVKEWHYSRLYTPETREIIELAHAKEIKLFGYKFQEKEWTHGKQAEQGIAAQETAARAGGNPSPEEWQEKTSPRHKAVKNSRRTKRPIRKD